MPFRSQAQAKWMFANKPEMAKEWAAKTGSIKGLPKKVKGKKESQVMASKKGMKLGQGGRFAALKAKIAKKGGVRNPGAVAASIGRKKYGKTRFQKLAAKGRKGK